MCSLDPVTPRTFLRLPKRRSLLSLQTILKSSQTWKIPTEKFRRISNGDSLWSSVEPIVWTMAIGLQWRFFKEESGQVSCCLAESPQSPSCCVATLWTVLQLQSLQTLFNGLYLKCWSLYEIDDGVYIVETEKTPRGHFSIGSFPSESQMVSIRS